MVTDKGLPENENLEENPQESLGDNQENSRPIKENPDNNREETPPEVIEDLQEPSSLTEAQEISSSDSKKKEISKTLLKIFVSLFFLFLIFFKTDLNALLSLLNPFSPAPVGPIVQSKQDLAGIFENISRMNLSYAPFIILFIVLNYVIGAFRWKQLLVQEDIQDVSVKYLTNLYFIGAFFNNFMPTSIGGDVYKMYQLGKKIKNAAVGISSTFMERFTGMIALVFVSYAGLLFGMSDFLATLPSAWTSNQLYVTLFKIAAFSGFWVLSVVGFLSLGFLSKRILFLKDIYNAILAYNNEKKVLVIAFLTSFIVQLLSIFTQYFILLSLGITIPITYALFIFPVITLAGFFIPSINSLGVQEFFYKELLFLRGISNPLALGASLLYQFARLLVSLVGGVLYAMGKGE